MFKKIIIHMGLHKTGTTSIQNFIFENRQILFKNNILYPEFKIFDFTPRNLSWPFYTMVLNDPSNYHLNISNSILGDEANKLKHDLLTQFYNLKNCKSDSLLISAEGLSNFNREELVTLFNIFSAVSDDSTIFEFHVFERETVDYINSIIQERLKGGTRESKIFNELTKSTPSNTYNKWHLIKDIFKNSQAYTHAFEDACKHKNGIEGYFFNVILCLNGQVLLPKKKNQSLSNESYLLIREYIDKSKNYSEIPINNSEYKSNIAILSNIIGSKYKPSTEQINKLLNFSDRNKNKAAWFSIYDISESDFEKDIFSKSDSENIINSILSTSNECQKILVDYLRDLAVSIEAEDLESSYKIMLIAKCLRPEGPFINKKTQEYLNKLPVEK